MGREYSSKVAGIWFPTFAFVAAGFDHVVVRAALLSHGDSWADIWELGQYVLYPSGDFRGDSRVERWTLHRAFDDPFAAGEHCWRRGKSPLRAGGISEFC